MRKSFYSNHLYIQATVWKLYNLQDHFVIFQVRKHNYIVSISICSMLLVVVVVVESLTCDGKYFYDQLAVRWDQAGPGWRNYLAVGKYWCKLTGPQLYHHHHHQPPIQEGRGKHLYPTLPPLYIIIAAYHPVI